MQYPKLSNRTKQIEIALIVIKWENEVWNKIIKITTEMLNRIMQFERVLLNNITI